MKSGHERRFCCPLCGDAKPRDDAHRSLCVNSTTGAYFCHRCGEKGVVKEKRGEPVFIPKPRRAAAALSRAFKVEFTSEPVTKDENAAGGIYNEIYAESLPLKDTAGERYLNSRGIPIELAEAAGVRFSTNFYKRPAVIFPIYNRAGNLVAINGRFVDGREAEGKLKTQTAGKKSAGLFVTPGALEAEIVAVCESPIDALSLHLCGLPSVALIGTSAPEWISPALAFKKVAGALDADQAGDEASAPLMVVLRSRGASSVILKPVGGKDWNEILVKQGKAHLQAFIEEKIAEAFPHHNVSRSIQPSTVPTNCPFCSIELVRKETEVLVRSCCSSCGFDDFRFTENRKAVFAALSAMHDQLTAEEYQAIEDALNERTAIIADNSNLDHERAMQAAENDVLPRIFASYLTDWNSINVQ
jgi:hypothetical protein